MKEGPDIALIASLIGDPARANMLTALMDGKAYTATELAAEAGITQQTASTNLKKLESGGLIRQRKQGRHRYFALFDEQVGNLLESMMGLAAARGHVRTRTGPKDPALRHARICYDHLAGELAVSLLDSLLERRMLREDGEELHLTDIGESFFGAIGIDLDSLTGSRRPVCKSCLDWSMRRSHLAGGLGKAVLDHTYAAGWARRIDGTRIVAFTPVGESAFRKAFDIV
ncbi:MAG: winged helix-turn-helix domain-containing protein [Alphaproteobacteria bacterium]|nr:winged helix-turn-helix domain-containing protein [Alphaproteobacteria bacterium]